ncbi:histidine kinase [Natronorubrum sp. JWXQ-INN-674]|uniref:Histidine kinase n=1 Tax=Natronorubrum halalkaliphilum TaxID=2691917 RepID=A0A6B0VLD7_9EURY|nr:sensor domain-containing protein [Natronorubrum halalkaliphilum]MXV61389.1 histidine kinase [Natronorubrum halalkaliphilum]
MCAAADAVTDRQRRIAAGVRRFVGVSFRRQTYLNLAYLLLAFPLGIAYVVFVAVGFGLGVGLSVILVGLPLLAVVFVISLAIAGFDRWLTAALLTVDIEPRTRPAGETRREQIVSVVTHPKTWSSVLYLPTKLALGTVSFALAVTGLSTGASMLMIPFYYDQPGLYVGVFSDRAPEIHQSLYLGWDYLLVGIEGVITVGYWEITTLPQALAAAALGFVVLCGTFHALNALARLWGRFARLALEDGDDPLAVAVRMLRSPPASDEPGASRRDG